MTFVRSPFDPFERISSLLPTRKVKQKQQKKASIVFIENTYWNGNLPKVELGQHHIWRDIGRQHQKTCSKPLKNRSKRYGTAVEERNVLQKSLVLISKHGGEKRRRTPGKSLCKSMENRATNIDHHLSAPNRTASTRLQRRHLHNLCFTMELEEIGIARWTIIPFWEEK